MLHDAPADRLTMVCNGLRGGTVGRSAPFWFGGVLCATALVGGLPPATADACRYTAVQEKVIGEIISPMGNGIIYQI